MLSYIEDHYSMLSELDKIFHRVTQTHWIFIIIGSLFGVIYILITPPMWGFDEVAHFNRAYQISEGKLIPPVNADKTPEMPKNLVELEYYVYGDLMNNTKDAPFRKDVDSRDVYNNLLSHKFSQEQQNIPIIAAYSPVSYVAPSLGIATARALDLSIGSAIAFARFFSLALYLALGFLALYILRDKKVKWVIFSVSLLPMSLFQAAVVSADGVLIGLSLLFVSSFFALLFNTNTPKKKMLLSIVITTAILMPIIKINYLFLSLGLLLLPSNLFKTKKIMYLLKFVYLLSIIIPSIVWSIITNVTKSSTSSERPDGALVVPSEQIHYILHHPIEIVITAARTLVTTSDSYIASMTSSIGWNGTQLPFVFIFLAFFCIFLASVFAKQELVNVRKKIYFLSLLSVLGIASIFGVLYVAFNPTGYPQIDGVQGRYFIPFLAPLVLLIATLLPIEVRIKEKTAPILFITGTFVVLVFSIIYYCLATY